MSDPLEGRLSVRPRELARMTGLAITTIRHHVDEGLIPRCPNTGKSVVIPAWSVRAWQATGDWRHPDYKPDNATAPAAVTAGA